jgi:hypothetical protein
MCSIKVSFKVQSLSGFGTEFRRPGRLVSAGSVCGWWHTEDTGPQISLILKGAHYVIILTDKMLNLLITCVFAQQVWLYLLQKVGL